MMEDKRIVGYLIDTGINPRTKGFKYLYDGIDMVIKNGCKLPPMVRKLYPDIGEKNDDSWVNVERNMRTSIRTSKRSDIKYTKVGDYISKAAVLVSLR